MRIRHFSLLSAQCRKRIPGGVAMYLTCIKDYSQSLPRYMCEWYHFWQGMYLCFAKEVTSLIFIL